jgi:hypothetical protein
MQNLLEGCQAGLDEAAEVFKVCSKLLLLLLFYKRLINCA